MLEFLSHLATEKLIALPPLGYLGHQDLHLAIPTLLVIPHMHLWLRLPILSDLQLQSGHSLFQSCRGSLRSGATAINSDARFHSTRVSRRLELLSKLLIFDGPELEPQEDQASLPCEGLLEVLRGLRVGGGDREG